MFGAWEWFDVLPEGKLWCPLIALGRVCWEEDRSAGSWELRGTPEGDCKLGKDSDVLVGLSC